MKFTQSASLIFYYTIAVVIAITAFGFYSYYSVSDELYSNLTKEIVFTTNNIERISGKYIKELSPPSAYSNKTESTNTLPESLRILNDLSSIIPHGLLQLANNSNKIIFKSEKLGKTTLPILPSGGSALQTEDSQMPGQPIENSNNIDPESDVILSGETTGMPGDSALMEYEIGGQAYLLFVKRTDNMVVSFAIPFNNNNEILKELTSRMVWAAIVIIIISLTVMHLTARTRKRPLLSIQKTADRISSNTLDLRFPESGGNEEIAALTTKLNKLIERLEKSYKRIKQFTSDASHELRTPLAILRGELEIALLKEKSVEEYEIIITSALEEVNRLINVVETLLELSRADSGRVSMNFQKGNMSSLLKDIAEDAEILAESKNTSVSTSIDPGIEFNFDSIRMHEAILNIIDNAVKYTPTGGSLKLGLQEFEGYAEITVSDNGIGIRKDQLDKIFERFFRIGDNSQKIQGMGLGLSIVRWIVDAHNGKVLVESQPGIGTTFSIRLPKATNSNKISTNT